MDIRFWGTRGSIPTPGPSTGKYGGNTSCVEVQTGDGTRIILDCGTGARELGQHLIRLAPKPLRLHLFIGHVHWDHIQGFPFFAPAFLPETELHLYAPRGFERNLEAALTGQMQNAYFPVRLQELRSNIRFTELEEGFFRIGDVLVEAQYLNHTAPTLAYRITSDGATVVYATDHEPFWQPHGPEFQHPGDQRHTAFLKDADLLIHDAQYTEAEYPEKRGWGHSTVEYATDAAMAAGVRRLALFHHDPTRDDAALAGLEALARERVARQGAALEVFAALEGMTLSVEGRRRARRISPLPAMVHVPIAGSRVLGIGSNKINWSAIDEQFHEENLQFRRVASLKTALAQAEHFAPDIAIVDAQLLDADSTDLISTLRDRAGLPTLPVVLLTSNPNLEAGLFDGDGSFTDYLAKPFTPAMVRTRVRAWLARSRREPAAGLARSPLQRRDRSHDRLQSEGATRVRIGEALACVPGFDCLAPDEIDLLSARATEESYRTGQSIVEEGDQAEHVFVILSGSAQVLGTSTDSSRTLFVLAELGPGELFGEVSILTGMARTATIVAAEPVRCIALPATEFLRVLETTTGLAAATSRVLARQLFDTSRRFARNTPDRLTGLLGRQSLQDQYRGFASLARREKTRVRLLLLNIVDLKDINDRFGYSVGDQVVRAVADALVESAQKTDLIARWGGEEFVVLLAAAKRDATAAIVERVRARLTRLAFSHDLPLAVKCRFGVASSAVPPASVDELIRQADENMLRRKVA